MTANDTTTANEITVSVDYENNAEQWWDAVSACNELPVGMRTLLDKDEVTLSSVDADALLDWASGLPGWSDGPEYAPNPLVV